MGRRKKIPPNPAFTNMKSGHIHFVALYSDMLVSEIYCKLSSAAKEVYTLIRLQYKGDYSGNTVKCPYNTFQKKYGMRRSTVSRALTELESFGFIDILRGGLRHMPNEYTFSEAWKTRTIEEAEEMYEEKKKIKRLEKIMREEHRKKKQI